MVSLSAKFEVSRFTRYEAMKDGAKCRKWGWFEVVRVQYHHSIERIRLPIRL